MPARQALEAAQVRPHASFLKASRLNLVLVNRAPAKFEEGDIVQLRSGGPRMSLRELLGDRGRCMWFDEAGRLHEKEIPLDLLIRLRDTPPDK